MADTKGRETAAGTVENGIGAAWSAPSWGLLLGLILFGLTLVLVQARDEPPAPRGADAPAAEFSAARAGDVLRTLVGDGRPHPVGSPANDLVRERILAELRRLGYAPEVQDGVWCSYDGPCARLRNVVARFEGASGPGEPGKPGTPGGAVLLMAHYDSVAAGPGVGDDLSGVATILEVARALKTGPPLKSPVILLLDDGEEAGLLGAELFANRHPAAREVGVVVNLEARGTGGPSLMFETSGEDAWMISRYASAATHPVTSSLYATIYDLMPNDTDLSVFKRKGVNGINFAFLENPNFYHTPQDSVDNLSMASLQHHGDNALASVRALSEENLAAPPAGDAVFFDVLSLGVVRWPKGWTLPLAVLALALTAIAARRALRRPDGLSQLPQIPRRALLFGILGFWGTVVVSGLAAFGLYTAVRGAMPYNWVDRPQAEIAAFWMLGTALTLLIAGALGRRAGEVGLWSGVWIGWSVLGVAVAIAAPGIAYLFVVPALIAGVLGLLTAPGRLASALVPGLAAAVLWMPVLSPLYGGLGSTALIAIGLLVALIATTLSSLVPASGILGRRWLPLAALAVMAVCLTMAFLSAPFSKAAPQPVPLQFQQDADTGQARWLALGGRPLPGELRKAAQFSTNREQIFEWGSPNYRAFIAPAPHLEAPGPQVSVLEDSTVNGERHLRLLLTSNRGAREAALLIPKEAGLKSAAVDGAEVLLVQEGRPKGMFSAIGSITLPAEGVEVKLVLTKTGPADLFLYDQSEGLPPAGEALLRARPDDAVSFQDGDTTSLVRKLRL